MDIFSLVMKMKEAAASDLYLTVGVKPTFRTGFFLNGDGKVLKDEDVWRMAEQIISREQIDELKKNKEMNIAFSDENGERYRANFFFQQYKLGMVIRHIKKEVPSIEALGLPEIFKESIMYQNGLVLIAGSSGNGKSTSIAAMLDHRNKNGGGHIVTVEDPIEYVHQNDKCIFTQREIEIDTHSWANALKNTMRQRPDVIYIGEIRDAETLTQVLRMAETGHLCIATLHAINASHAVERIINMLAPELRNQHLHSLAQVLRVVIGQKLILGSENKTHICLDILKNEGLAKPLIMEGKISDLRDFMEKSQDIGMVTFDRSLYKLVVEGKISRETAMNKADNPEIIKLMLMKKSNLSQTPLSRQASAMTYKDETGF